MKSSTKFRDVCRYELKKRHTREYGLRHRFLTEEQKSEIKRCIQEFRNKHDILEEILSLLSPYSKIPISNELKDALLFGVYPQL